MTQIVFSPTAARELSRLPRELQLLILGHFKGSPINTGSRDETVGEFERGGRILKRLRLQDYRVYFESRSLGLVVHRILSRNSIKDFLFRSNLPVGDESQIEADPHFWEMLDAAWESKP